MKDGTVVGGWRQRWLGDSRFYSCTHYRNSTFIGIPCYLHARRECCRHACTWLRTTIRVKRRLTSAISTKMMSVVSLRIYSVFYVLLIFSLFLIYGHLSSLAIHTSVVATVLIGECSHWHSQRATATITPIVHPSLVM